MIQYYNCDRKDAIFLDSTKNCSHLLIGSQTGFKIMGLHLDRAKDNRLVFGAVKLYIPKTKNTSGNNFINRAI